MAVVLMKQVSALISGDDAQVVIGASGRVLDAVIYDFDGNVQDLTGWSAQIIGTSDDLPGVSIDVAGEILGSASAGTFRWTHVGDFLSQIGEKSSARFRCQVKWTDAGGLVDYSHTFQLTFVVDGTGEDTNMNAAAVQALIDATPRHPFEFPYGAMKTGAPIVGLEVGPGQTKTIFSASGAGIVRNLGWIVTATSPDLMTSRLHTLTVKVYVDGEATPSISVPLFTLCGMEHPDVSLGGMPLAVSAVPPTITSALTSGISATTSAFELTASPHQGSPPYNTIYGASGNFKLPMPYSNGIEIKVTADSSDTRNFVYINTIYQDALPNCWNESFRLRAVRSNETIAVTAEALTAKLTDSQTAVATSGTFPTTCVGKSLRMEGVSYNDILITARTSSTVVTVSTKDTPEAVLNDPVFSYLHAPHKFIDLPAGSAGYVALVVGACHQPDADVDILFEGNVRYFIDGESEPSLEWSSVEDWASGSYYFEQPNRNDEGGIMSHDAAEGASTKWSVYKNHGRHPVKYSNGFKATVPQYSLIGATTFNWTTFYYEDTA